MFGIPYCILLLGSVDGAHFAILAHTLELDVTVDLSEQGVVLANADVVARMDMGASLTNQNIAGQNELTISTLREELETHFQHVVTPPKLRYNQDIHPADHTM